MSTIELTALVLLGIVTYLVLGTAACWIVLTVKRHCEDRKAERIADHRALMAKGGNP